MTDKKKNILYVASAYGIFWLMLIVLVSMAVAGIIPMSGNAFELFRSITCWAPTLAVIVFRKKLCGSLKAFYQDAFKDRLNWGILLAATIVQTAAFFVSVCALSMTAGIPFGGLLGFSPEILAWGVLWTLLQGASGEESGWRGFLQPSLEKKYSVIKASIIVGLIWGFWHAPLWLLEAFTPAQLVQYVLSFLVMVTAEAVMMGVCYSRCRNLIVPVWMHFMVNIFSPFLAAGGTLADTGYYANYVTFMALFYAVAAVGYGVWHIKKSRPKAALI